MPASRVFFTLNWLMRTGAKMQPRPIREKTMLLPALTWDEELAKR